MRSSLFSVTLALLAAHVSAHSIFQDLWVNGVDQGPSCARMPQSNSPVTDVSSTTLRCNGMKGISQKCPVAAGDTVTVEMHAQPGDRSCKNVAIGGAHYGPVQVYMSKVADASTADGSAGWFKVFADTWSAKSGASSGDSDNWGTNDLNTCCGKMNVKIPTDIAPGDYLLRAEALALHTAGSLAGAQFYMTCYQLTVSGTGTASPSLVMIPGMYKATDPGIEVNIHAALSTYIAPGPTVYAGGSTKVAGGACMGVETISSLVSYASMATSAKVQVASTSAASVMSMTSMKTSSTMKASTTMKTSSVKTSSMKSSVKTSAGVKATAKARRGIKF